MRKTDVKCVNEIVQLSALILKCWWVDLNGYAKDCEMQISPLDSSVVAAW